MLRAAAALVAAGMIAGALTSQAESTSIARVGLEQLERDAQVVFTGVLAEQRDVHGRLERLRFRDVRLYRGGRSATTTLWSVKIPMLDLGVEAGRRYLVFAEPRPLWGGPPRLAPMGYSQGVFAVQGPVAANAANGSLRLDRLRERLRRARTPCGAARRGKAYLVRGGALVPVVRGRFRDDLGLNLYQLFRGPTRAERRAGISTAIPRGARILGWRQRGRVAEIDVSREFPLVASTRSHLARAQLVYTATQSDAVDRVRLLVAGKPLRVSIGGGPLRTADPVPRSNFGLTGGRILIETPSVGQRAGRPLCVRGSAVALSGRLRAELLDARGRRIAARDIELTGGAPGQRRAFEVTIRHSGRPRTLVVSEPSTRGERPRRVVRVQLG